MINGINNPISTAWGQIYIRVLYPGGMTSCLSDCFLSLIRKIIRPSSLAMPTKLQGLIFEAATWRSDGGNFNS